MNDENDDFSRCGNDTNLRVVFWSLLVSIWDIFTSL